MGRPGSCENFAEGNLSPGMFTGICRDVGGGFAPYLVAHKDQVFKLPGEVSHTAGAMMEPLSVVLQALHDNMPEQGEQVLVIGGGVIGNLFVQVIRALELGCEITVAEPSTFHADLATQAGADYLITDGHILKHAQQITGARAYKPMIGKEILMGGFPRIFDTVASTATLDASLRSLRIHGVLSIVGIGKEVLSDPTPLWLKLQTIRGVYCYGYYEDVDGQRRHMFEKGIDLARSKKVDLDSMVTHRFALEDYREMIEVNLNKGKHRALKTVVSFERERQGIA
jgi:threonine dehydrogenase-like Zn-dependent dehydrogenase